MKKQFAAKSGSGSGVQVEVLPVKISTSSLENNSTAYSSVVEEPTCHKGGQAFTVDLKQATPSIPQEKLVARQPKPRGIAFTVDMDGQNDQDVEQLTKAYYEQYFRNI